MELENEPSSKTSARSRAYDVSAVDDPRSRESRAQPSSHGVDGGSAATDDSDYVAQRTRERSLSVSPKTKLPDSTTHQEAVPDDRWNNQVTPAKRKLEPIAEAERREMPVEGELRMQGRSCTSKTDGRCFAGAGPALAPSSTTTSTSINGVPSVRAKSPPAPTAGAPGRPFYDPIQLDDAAAPDIAPTRRRRRLRRSSSPDWKRRPSEGAKPVVEQPTTGRPRSVTPASTSGSPAARSAPTDTVAHVQPVVPAKHEAGALSRNGAAAAASTSPHAPVRKRTRYDEPPIFARSASGSTGAGPARPKRHQPKHVLTAGGVAAAKQEGKDVPAESRSATARTGQAAPPSTDGPSASVAGPARPPPSLADDYDNPLGPWEPSITNTIPFEEVTRAIMDFLFVEVVDRMDVGVTPSAPGQLEIEAKLGQLIDRNTNERVRLPVQTECIFNKDHPSWHTAFRSSMTEVSLVILFIPHCVSVSVRIAETRATQLDSLNIALSTST